MKIKHLLIFLTSLILVSVALLTPHQTKSADEIFSAWQASTSFPYQLANHTTFTYSNKIYAVNGSAQTGASKKSVISSLISQNGSLGSWNNINADTPDALIQHTTVIKENKVYVLGGKVEPSGIGSSVDSVWLGNVNDDGSISGWTTLNALPKRLSKGKAVVVNNRIYFVGGATWTGGGSPVPSNSVYFANINADGTIGNWTPTTSLPTPLFGHGLIEANGKIITLGGSTNAGETPINKTYVAAVNPDGSLGSWSEGPNLPVGLRDGGAVKIGTFAIYAGGYSGQFSNKVYYSPIDGSGSLGIWSQSANNLPVTHCCGSLAVWYNRLYLSGGHDGANYLNSVYTTTTSAVPPPPSLPSLNVEDLKQYSPPWNDDVYDQAAGWSGNPTIERWGCALTSAAMVLKYHGHNLNPDALNDWLKAQLDGFLRNGLLNWLAISRYSRLHDSAESPTLQYHRLGTDTDTLIAELTAGRPAILAQPGHFVVGKSQTADSFGINDPAYADRLTLAAYGNSFSSLGSYQPTHTDLSYLMLVADGDTDLSLSDPNATSYLEAPLTDDGDGSTQSGESLRILLLPQPGEGNYTATVSGTTGLYTIQAYLYNPNGEVTLATLSGILAPEEEDLLNITITDEPQAQPVVTTASLLSDWQAAYDQSLISKKSLYKSVKSLLQAANKLWQVNQPRAAKKLFRAVKKLIKQAKYIDPAINEIMQDNIDLLLAQ